MKLRALHELMGHYISSLPEGADPEVQVHIGSGEYATPSERDYKLYYVDKDELEEAEDGALDGDAWNLEDGNINGEAEDYKFLFVIDAED